MAYIAWNDGLYLVGRLSQPMRSPASVASHLIEHPIGYDGSPEHMLMTLGASMWIRKGPQWYAEHCPGTYMEDVLTEQLTSVVMSMAQLLRMTANAPVGPKLSAEYEDLIWAVLVRASADNHALTGDAQIVQLAGWLRRGMTYAYDRWGGDQDGIYNAFQSAVKGSTDIIAGHESGEHPPHRRWRAHVRPTRGETQFKESS